MRWVRGVESQYIVKSHTPSGQPTNGRIIIVAEALSKE